VVGRDRRTIVNRTIYPRIGFWRPPLKRRAAFVVEVASLTPRLGR